MKTDTRPLYYLQFAITGTRPNGEVLYYVSSATQGDKFTPNAYDLACQFCEFDDAEARIEELQPKWQGLKLAIEKRRIAVN